MNPPTSARFLENKSVIVIGAGRGIGAAVAAHLGEQGAKLLLADVDAAAAAATADAIRSAGATADSMKVDVSSWEECKVVIARCVECYGRVDGLVNFAGIVYMSTPAEEANGDRARRLFEINLLGTYNAGVLAIQQMKKQGGGGAIVNVTSGAQAGITACAPYSASKGAIASLTYSWGIDCAADGIRVNAISPVATSAMTANTDEYMRQKGHTQWGRPFVDPASNAPAVAFLLSDASAQLNGQILRVHGDQLQLVGHPVVLQPVMERAHWDVPAIAAALEEAFGRNLPPLGLTSMQGQFVPMTKVNPILR